MWVSGPDLDVRETSIESAVFLEFDEDRFINARPWGQAIHEPAQQRSAPRQTEAERRRHVVLVPPQEIEELLDRATVKDEVRQRRL